METSVGGQQSFGNLHNIKRRALAQVVTDHEEREGVCGPMGPPHTTDERVVLSRRHQGGGVLGDLDSRSPRECVNGVVNREPSFELCEDRRTVAGKYGHSYTGTGDGQIGYLKDLSTLVSVLLLLVCFE